MLFKANLKSYLTQTYKTNDFKDAIQKLMNQVFQLIFEFLYFIVELFVVIRKGYRSKNKKKEYTDSVKIYRYFIF